MHNFDTFIQHIPVAAGAGNHNFIVFFLMLIQKCLHIDIVLDLDQKKDSSFFFHKEFITVTITQYIVSRKKGNNITTVQFVSQRR